MNEEHTLKFVRLNNGDDVIAEVVELGEDGQIDYMLINPLKVIYAPTEPGSSFLQVAFMPWVFTKICDDQQFFVHAVDVLTMNNVSDYMEEYYWKNLDHFLGPEKEEEYIPEEPTRDEPSVEDILEALNLSKRTYH